MPNPRKGKPERITASEAARRLRITRPGVIGRLARQIYKAEVVGGVTFVIADERFLADVQAAEEAAKEQTTEQAVA